ncbi:hypothetical protein ABH937_004022 [Kitasatospora sp. GAS1066B]
MVESRIPERQAQLLKHAQKLTPPSGWKVEVSGDEVIVTAAPSVIHQRNLLMVREQFDARRPAELMPSENTDLASPHTGKLRNPDLTYIPFAVVELGAPRSRPRRPRSRWRSSRRRIRRTIWWARSGTTR